VHVALGGQPSEITVGQVPVACAFTFIVTKAAMSDSATHDADNI
jgi:hypothetical protein